MAGDWEQLAEVMAEEKPDVLVAEGQLTIFFSVEYTYYKNYSHSPFSILVLLRFF